MAWARSGVAGRFEGWRAAKFRSCEATYCQKPASTAVTDKGGKDKGAVFRPSFR